MTNDVGTPEWIEKNNLILSRLETSDDANITPIELGVELSSFDRQFTLCIDNTGVQIKIGLTPRCNLRIKIPDEIASEIHEGTLSVAEAISNGEIKVAGDINTLMQSSGTFSQLSKALQNKLA
jgi:putative sterol carrier protein